MTTKAIRVEGEGVTLSLMIWRFLNRQPPGYVEAVLDYNPGLAALGTFIPVGTVVVFPLDAIPAATPSQAVVRLWD